MSVPKDLNEPAESPAPLSPVGTNDTVADDDKQDGTTMQKTKSLEQIVSLPRELFIVGVIIMAQFTTQVGLGQALALLHVIGDDFGVSNPGTLAWFIAGYSLTVGTFILVSGRFGDLFGYKRMLVIGYVWYAIWSVVAGLSVYSNHVLFVWARVLQGLGPSICLPNALALLGAIYDPGFRKNMAFSAFGACAPGGSIVGSVFGAIFGQFAWWPWAFWSFSIALVGLATLAAWLIPDPQAPRKYPTTIKGYIDELDLYAATIGVTALVLFNFAWNQAPIVGWSSPYILVCLILGILMIPLFFYLEIKVVPNPLLPFSVLTSTNAFVLGCIACGWGNFGIWVFYLWQIMIVSRGISPLLAAAYTSPVAIVGVIAAGITGVLLGKIRPSWVMTIALTFFLIGNLLVVTLPPDQIYWGQIFVTTLVAPFGMDMSFPAATLYLSNSIEKERQGVAASLVNTVVNYSISLALGFAGTIEVHVNNEGRTPADTLHGFRSALYFGTGLATFGLLLSLAFVAKQYWDERKENSVSDPEKREIPTD